MHKNASRNTAKPSLRRTRKHYTKAVTQFWKPRVNRSLGTQTTKINRSVTFSAFTTSNAGDTIKSYSFQLSDLPNYTEFTGLFDAYRITGVEVIFYPVNTVNTTGAAVNPTQAITCVDFDGISGPTLVSDLEQYDTAKWHWGLRPIKRKLVPRVALAAYSGAFTSYAEAKENQWIDCASPSVQHYGLFFGGPTALNASGAQSWQPVATYFLEFKRTR